MDFAQLKDVSLKGQPVGQPVARFLSALICETDEPIAAVDAIPTSEPPQSGLLPRRGVKGKLPEM